MICLVFEYAVSVVLMAVECYQQMTDIERSFSDRLVEWRQKHIKELARECEFSSVRQIEVGRDFSWLCE